MKTILRICAGILLLFNGTGAIYGGWSFITQPDGSGLGMTTVYLEHSPFSDYFYPGIILLLFNGIFSIVVFGLLLVKNRHYTLYVMLQGIILCCWLLVQLAMIRTFSYMHLIMGITGILLIVCGKKLAEKN